MGAFAYAGQVCISVQRLFVHESVWDAVHGALRGRRRRRCAWATRSTRDTTSGPWSTRPRPRARSAGCDEAVAEGARAPARRHGRRPLVPADRPRRRPSPATGLLRGGLRAARGGFPFSDFEAAFAEVNASRFGLQAGVFTNDLAHAWRAFEALEVGGVIVNDVPTYRVDHMPYGGVKDSGLGREGVRWAIEDMTELRLMVVARPG